MVFTIHRYIFRDLLKTFLLTTVVLSVVLGLGGMLRPLQEFGVAPGRVPELLLCTLPITLTMVIPVAALLSATLNYGRLASDNEINACRSSGIGLLTLIYPAMALALMVGLLTLLLAFHVIPNYAKKAEVVIKDDAESIVFNVIDRGTFSNELFPGMVIHADRVYPEHNLLTGVAFIRIDEMSITDTFTARQVEVDFRLGGDSGRNEVAFRLHDAAFVDSTNDSLAAVERQELVFPVPSLFRDNIKFKKLSELKEIRSDMTLFGPIRELLDSIRSQLLVELFFQWADQRFAGWGHILDLVCADGRRLRIYGRGCRLRIPTGLFDVHSPRKNRSAEIIGDGNTDWPIRVELFAGPKSSRPEKLYYAKRAELSVQPDFQSPRVSLRLGELEWFYPDDSQRYRLERDGIGDIVLPGDTDMFDRARSVGLDEVLAGPIPLQAQPSAYLAGLYSRAKEACESLRAEIEVELHSRLAFGVSCVVLVLFGAALGILLRSGHLLTAFGVSCLPAALCLITIFTGKHMAEQTGVSITAGIVFLWSGLVVVSAANLVVYRFLRH